MQAENQHVRRSVWGFQTPKESEASVPGHTILGDMIQQPPIIMNQPASSGVGKVLAGAVLGASLLGIPGAGIASYLYAMNQKAGSPAPVVSPPPADNETVGLGLLKFEDLKSPTPTP